jgi:hypothetical protein
MLAAEDSQVILRHRKARNAADAGCIGKFRNAAVAEKRRETDPPVFSNGLFGHRPQ